MKKNELIGNYFRFVPIRLACPPCFRNRRDIKKPPHHRSIISYYALRKIKAFNEFAFEFIKMVTQIGLTSIVIIFIVVLVKEVFSTSIIIQPISTPDDFSKHGYSPNVFACRVAAEMANIDQKAITKIERQSISEEKSLPDIKMPGGLISFYTLTSIIKELINQNDISVIINVTIDKSNYIAKIKILGGDYHNSNETVLWRVTDDFEMFINQISEKTTQLVAPYIWSRYEIANIISQDNNQRLKCYHLEEVIRFYEEMLNRQPEKDDKWALLGIGVVLDEMGDKKNAIEKYKSAINKDPKFALPYSNWGAILAEQGKYKEAIEKMKTAIKIDPKFTNAYYNLGLALSKQNNSEEAIYQFQKIIKLDPKFFKAYYHLGLELVKQNKHREAAENFQMVINNDPNFADAYFHLGYTLRKLGKYEEAIDKYQKNLILNPKSNNVCYYIACAYALQNDKIKAYEWLLNAINRDDLFRKRAKTDKDFDNLRKAEWTKALIYGSE